MKLKMKFWEIFLKRFTGIAKVPVERLVTTLLETGAHTAVWYGSPKLTARATRTLYNGKFDKSDVEISLRIGKPNYEEREFIALLKDTRQPFPLNKIQLKFPPKRRK